MKSVLSILLTTTVFVAITPLAHAFCSAPKIRIDDEYFASALVFDGTIVRDQKIGVTPDGAYDGHVFSWRVNRAFRGPVKPGDVIKTYSGDDSARFPEEAEEGHQVGRRFLLFASTLQSRKGEYYIDDCGNSVVLSKASRVMTEIHQLPQRHGGLLYGAMFDGDVGVKIIATGAQGGVYSTVSNDKGKFAVHLPPGLYKVTATAPDRVYEDFEFSYKTSEHVAVPDGGSAGLAFREKGWDGKKLPYVAP